MLSSEFKNVFQVKSYEHNAGPILGFSGLVCFAVKNFLATVWIK